MPKVWIYARGGHFFGVEVPKGDVVTANHDNMVRVTKLDGSDLVIAQNHIVAIEYEKNHFVEERDGERDSP
jgi:hypothetical protein